MKRTNTCGQLTDKDIDKQVCLNGWCHSRRDHGGIIFIDLRDRYGLTQIVFDPKPDTKVHSLAEKLGREDVVSVKAKVRARKEGMENPKLKTGKIEVLVDGLEILNKAETPPIEVDDRVKINEDVRLRYRYIDLRKQALQNNLILRHKTVKAVRDFYDRENFLEIETPMLAKSTPEGARDYLVPSRVNPGKFFALPQSPQLFKQLLMVAGFDRYMQIVKCFRDEDLRADRQPEFTQIDVEMSFIDEEDIYSIHEKLMKHIWKEVLGANLKIPFPRLTYADAMERYGSDKPDTRFGLELVDVTAVAKKSDFKVFTDNINNGGIVKAINVSGGSEKFSRKDIDSFIEFVRIYGAKGLAWMKVTDAGLESSVVKFFKPELQKELIKKLGAKKSDLLLFVSDRKHFVVNDALGNLRLHMAKKLGIIDEKTHNFLWVTDFPLVEFDEDAQRHVAIHHPFTSPKDEDLAVLDKEPAKVRAKAYDLVLNGVELGGGSIRIHKSDVQEKIFRILGISKQEAELKFGFLLEAFRYGAPPHGGIAFGLDRLIAMLTRNESIREVIAFPKTKDAESLMEGAPSDVDNTQLKELHLKLDIIATPKKNIVFEQIKAALNKEKIEFETIGHKPVYTSKEAAIIRGTKLEQGAKALICKTEKGYVQAVISGAKELNEGKLKEVLHVKSLRLANADEVRDLTGISIGAVPPFGNLWSIEVYIDKSVTANEEIAFNAGTHTNSIKMKSKDLVKVTGAKVAEFSK
ncbi:aspartate--tRNA ligase [Candidatus Woesearchaeota archaeon]|nr:aspartate--tRNA ligase [Candidatus Woesearchaeota archaeon]